MFPWSREFVWDAGHLAFFGALYAVLGTIGAALLLAAYRLARHVRSRRLGAVAWRVRFEALPASARACRHQITGEAPGRVCREGFDCRSCAEHPELSARRGPEGGPEGGEAVVGFDPSRRYYHRSHTWARLERNGTVTVGLDGIARRLLGAAAEVELPAAGTRVEANGPLGRVRTPRTSVVLFSPIDGTVLDARGSGLGFKLRVQPEKLLDIRHLLSGPEAKSWSLRELDRLRQAVGTLAGPVLADGGELVADVGAALPRARYEALIEELLLQA